MPPVAPVFPSARTPKANATYAVIIETPEAATRAEEILSAPGADAVYIGPWDLSLTLGRTPASGGSELKLIDAVRAAAESAGASPGMASGGHDHVERRVGHGFRFIGVNDGAGFLRQAGTAAFGAARGVSVMGGGDRPQ